MIVNGDVTVLLLSFSNTQAKGALKVVGVEGRFTRPNDFETAVRNVRDSIHSITSIYTLLDYSMALLC